MRERERETDRERERITHQFPILHYSRHYFLLRFFIACENVCTSNGFKRTLSAPQLRKYATSEGRPGSEEKVKKKSEERNSKKSNNKQKMSQQRNVLVRKERNEERGNK